MDNSVLTWTSWRITHRCMSCCRANWCRFIYINVLKAVTAFTSGACYLFLLLKHRLHACFCSCKQCCSKQELLCVLTRSTQITCSQAGCPLAAQSRSSKKILRQITRFGSSSYFKEWCRVACIPRSPQSGPHVTWTQWDTDMFSFSFLIHVLIYVKHFHFAQAVNKQELIQKDMSVFVAFFFLCTLGKMSQWKLQADQRTQFAAHKTRVMLIVVTVYGWGADILPGRMTPPSKTHQKLFAGYIKA